jgi:hypothetical protein
MDLIAGCAELIGNILVGNKNKWGFACNLLGCLVWIWVAIHCRIYGLLLVVVPGIFVNIRNFRKWTIIKK